MENCERRLFQRPDDAIHRGVDVQAEADIAGPENFLSNFEPLTLEQARALVEHVVEFDQYTEPMKQLLANFVERPGDGIRGVVGAPAAGERQAHRRIRAICRSGRTWSNPRDTVPGADRGAAGARDPGVDARCTCR